jgi:hypothetical protein
MITCYLFNIEKFSNTTPWIIVHVLQWGTGDDGLNALVVENDSGNIHWVPLSKLKMRTLDKLEWKY